MSSIAELIRQKRLQAQSGSQSELSPITQREERLLVLHNLAYLVLENTFKLQEADDAIRRGDDPLKWSYPEIDDKGVETGRKIEVTPEVVQGWKHAFQNMYGQIQRVGGPLLEEANIVIQLARQQALDERAERISPIIVPANQDTEALQKIFQAGPEI